MPPGADAPLEGHEDRVAVVTAGDSGIGLAVVDALARPGVHVYMASRQPERARAATASFRERGAAVSSLELDVIDADSIERAFADLPRIDVLVNSVGVHSYRTVEELTVGDFEHVLGPNLIGPFLVCQRVLPLMPDGGRIVNITSRSMLGGQRVAHYAAAKAGVVGLTCALAAESIARGITVNAVAPALVDTPMSRRRLGDVGLEAVARASPLGRLVRVEEVAGAVAFLTSPAAAAITGQCLLIDGGASLPI